ncbi:MAG: GvpL/GvpF family gas vesicle protein [Chloroflexi bacterium]|nr:GvpL/GvpF family gas vesicle protein [Chloroflexota bacterium]
MSAIPLPSSAGTYVYCVVAAASFFQDALPWRARSIGGRGDLVRIVQFQDLAAVVSTSPAAHYDIGRENTLAHQLVIEEAMARADVLPVRFGTVARSDQEVREKLLRRQFGELHTLLDYVRGRVELGLKVFWNRERLFAEIAVESDEIRALRDAIAGKSPEETHYQRIQLGQLTEQALLRKRDREAEAILHALRPPAVEARVNRVLTDTMVLNAAFLVDRTQEWLFDAQVNALDDTHAGRLLLKYVGPLPPYNFVNLIVHWED